MDFFNNAAQDMDKIQRIQISMFREMMEKAEYSNLKGKVLIASDRLSKLATELSLYMKYNTSADVLGVIQNINEIEMYSCGSVDYLILVGYMRREENYNIIDILRVKNPTIKVVQWALLDDYIKTINNRYNINFAFDRMLPPREFMQYLDTIKD